LFLGEDWWRRSRRTQKKRAIRRDMGRQVFLFKGNHPESESGGESGGENVSERARERESVRAGL
jgi:hypothetical protein